MPGLFHDLYSITELEGMWKESVVTNLSTACVFALERLRKTTWNLNADTLCPSRVSNREPSE